MCPVLIFLSVSVSFAGRAGGLVDPEGKILKLIEDFVVAKHPEWRGAKTSVTFSHADKIFENLRGLKGEASFKILEVYGEIKPVGNVIFPIQVAAGKSTSKIFIRSRVEVYKKVVTAAKYIKRGGGIEPGDLALEDRDVSLLPQKYYENLAQVISTEAKTAIPLRSTIFEWMIKETPLVHRGDKITIKVLGPSLVVKTEGIAMEDGYQGKKIKVSAKNSKTTLDGIVVSAGEVEVKLK